MIRFALSARTSTDDLQDLADSLRRQTDTARRLIAPHGQIDLAPRPLEADGGWSELRRVA
jgi:hypothetical protein